MNSLVKDALKLVIITVVAGLVLGAVYGITKKPIADQEAKAQMEAYKACLLYTSPSPRDTR